MDATDPDLPTAWTLVLPIKGGPTAKSRLGGSRALAAALARDCLAAVLACPQVRRTVVVTADDETAAWTARAGAEVLRESIPGQGLDAAAWDALAVSQGRTAILLADLPALRPHDLSAALAAAALHLTDPPAPGQVLVPDADGTGTVLLAALDPGRLTPSFGPGSAARHQGAGAARLDLALPRLRRDTDTDSDLAEALALGCGPATLAALARSASGDPARWLG